ncbi:MAG: hypothetical protein EP344_12375 [Bacteroidetes bacterium]|nr:MAG: hypothetical protein EP344_12375 [Bacteroidota bacterium]
MNQLKSFSAPFFAALLTVAILSGCAQNAPENPKFNIASDEYSAITEQYIKHLANFEWEQSYALLSDDVVFKMPDGDTDTRTTFNGLDQVKEFWNNYQQRSGNDKVTFKDFVHIPVQVNQKMDFVGVTGVFDMCYFSAELHYGTEKAKVRMHWAFHFNDAKKIDGVFTYYDRTPIIEAANKNFLAQDEVAEEPAEEE